MNVRPRFRYWVPDASADHATLAADVKAAGDVGAGGVEVLGYYLYGGTALALVPSHLMTGLFMAGVLLLGVCAPVFHFT